MTLPNSAEVQSFIDGFRPAAEQVTASLGVATTQLLEIGLKKQFADGLISFLTAIAMLVVMLIVFKVFKHWYATAKKEEEEDGYVEPPLGIIVFIGAVVLMIVLMFFLMSAERALMHFIVPEWMLMEEILSIMG